MQCGGVCGFWVFKCGNVRRIRFINRIKLDSYKVAEVRAVVGKGGMAEVPADFGEG